MGASDSVERYWSVRNRVTANQYPYHGPLGGISRSGRCFFAWKEGFLIGTYRTFDEARESLVWRERLRPRCEMIRSSHPLEYGVMPFIDQYSLVVGELGKVFDGCSRPEANRKGISTGRIVKEICEKPPTWIKEGRDSI